MPSPQQRRTPTADHAESVRLVVLEGGRIGQKFLLDKPELVLGRADDCDMRFDDAQLSRRHATLRRLGPGLYEVCDLDSRNGTFVNGAPASVAISLKLGDRVRFGSNLVLQLTVHDPLEDQILQRQRLETLGRLVAGTAHDFNNMLAAVLSNIDYLESLPSEESVTGTNARECLSDMRSASQRAAELSQRLVGFARGERGSGVLDVSAVFAEVANVVARTFDRSISVRSEIAPRLTTRGEELELHQVLMNLCLNARDAMPDGGTLSLEAKRVDNQKQLELVVADSGTGMDASTKARIFESFFSTKQGAGAGLGLATVREIVQSLDGTIEVESELGKGSTFRLFLPRVAPRSGARTASTLESPTGEDEVFSPQSILLVDDEAMIRRSARRVLARAGHDVLEASCGAEALTLYKHGHPRPDVVLLDLSMPDGSGEDVLERLLALDPYACVIIITGTQDSARERAVRDAGALGFLHKPWTPSDLLELIETLSGGAVPSDRPTRA